MSTKKNQETVVEEAQVDQQVSAETQEASSSQTTERVEIFNEGGIAFDYDDPTSSTFKSDEEEVFGRQDFSKQTPMSSENTGFIGGNFFDGEGTWHATVVGETPGGKKVQIMKEEFGSFYRIAFAPGGELPQELQGSFTSYDRAEKHARIWLSNLYGQTDSQEAKS